MKNITSRIGFSTFAAAIALTCGFPAAYTGNATTATVASTASAQGGGDNQSGNTAKSDDQSVVIQTVEPDVKLKKAKEVAWLGLAVEESSEVVAAQLGLKSGEGLTVTMIASGSPAEKAEFHKNDVLVDFDGQMLVYPMQLRKLVQMREEGETVKVTFFRSGKKQTTSLKLGKTAWEQASDQAMQNLQLQLQGLKGLDVKLDGLDKVKMDLDLKHTMEQTRKAIEDAVRSAASDKRALASVNRALESVARAGVDVDTETTVTVHNKEKSNRTIVQTDETGSYVIESGEKTHLTARDRKGKLLFEGEIDTPEQKKKVPKEVWEKIEPMLDQIIVTPGDAKPKSE